MKIFYGSMASSAGSIFKSLQVVQLPDLDKMKADLNEFINRTDIEVLSINHQSDDGVMSVLVYYKKK
jgi:hypothetical protein